MIVGCYSLDLYCDTNHQKLARKHSNGPLGMAHYDRMKPGQFTGHTYGACKRDARKAGWTFKRDGKVYCPMCSQSGDNCEGRK